MRRPSGSVGSPRRDQSPGELPDVTPRQVTQGHDITLQAVIEMQRTLGEVSAKVDRLISDVDSQGKKIDKVRMRMAWLAGGAATVGFLVMLLLAVAKIIPWAGASGQP